MENEHKYRVVSWWTSGQTGIAKSNSAPNAIHFTAPPQFGGLVGRWTPEDLLMTAWGVALPRLCTQSRVAQNSNTRTWQSKRREPSRKRTLATTSARLLSVRA